MLSQSFSRVTCRQRTLSLVQQVWFSTTLSRYQLVQPPIRVFGLEGRYAHALYSAAVKQKQLDSVHKDFTKIKKLLGSEPRLEDFLLNPTLSRDAKRDAFTKVLKTQNCSNVTEKFFDVVGSNGRLNKTNEMLTAFEKIMSAHRGEIVCTITTAKALDDKTRKDLVSTLDGFLQKGQQLLVHTKVDPALVGGMVVEIGDKYIDMSIASRVKLYRKALEEAVV